MALRLLGSKLSDVVVARHLVKGLPPLAKTAAPLETSAIGCPPRATNLLYDSSFPKVKAGFDSSFGRRNFGSGLPTENARMNSSKKDPSGPGNEKPPRPDGDCECSRQDVGEFMRIFNGWCFGISTACVGITIYNTIQIYRVRDRLYKYMDSISKSLDD